jgi:2-polyprenyl-3-methyl-5-hydroxy-6-metoxy-1,4-benzoquinol methylase
MPAMIGRRLLPDAYLAWNDRWGAPGGYSSTGRRLAQRLLPESFRPRLSGPFGFQPYNNRTRRFEYPWAYHAAEVQPGQRAVDLGGSLGGLQFVLAKAGLKVTNVDPGEAAPRGWPIDARSINALNRAFKTDVELRQCFLADADLESDACDRVFCISVLEHVDEETVPSIVAEVARILRPGGKFILTVDLFLDLSPFTDRETNVHGRNMDIGALVDASGLRLEQGDPAELYGFPEFDPKRVQSELNDYLFGDVAPCVAQALVLRKD